MNDPASTDSGSSEQSTNNNSDFAQLAHDLTLFGVTPNDIKELGNRGKQPQEIISELCDLSGPKAYPEVLAPARMRDNTIRMLPLSELIRLNADFVQLAQLHTFERVIPAGGAATRYLQLPRSILHSDIFDEANTPTEIYRRTQKEVTTLKEQAQEGNGLLQSDEARLKALQEVAAGIRSFWEVGICKKAYPFYQDLADTLMAAGRDIETLVKNENIKLIAHYLLDEEGLNYGALPKLLMKHHAYPEADGHLSSRTAMEEHIRESASWFKGVGVLRLHFIVSPEHHQRAEQMLDGLLKNPALIAHLGDCGLTPADLQITFSETNPATDSVALDLKTDEIARGLSGEPLLRNAGHGSVLSNISERPASGLWLKNVDNVLYDNPHIRAMVVLYERALAALGTELQTKANEYLHKLSSAGEGSEDPLLNWEALNFLQNDLQTTIDPKWIKSASTAEVSHALRHVLSRPIIVAGAVPLEPGQAGGGPFTLDLHWNDIPVRSSSIVEQAEFKKGAADPIFLLGEFFNPVMLFIARQRADGSLYPLEEVCNPSRSLRTKKPGPDGRLILTRERPGLWNGSLEGALQVNIALPSNVFSAVKSITGAESPFAYLHQMYGGQLLKDIDFDRGAVNHEIDEYLQGQGAN